ncbi:hypothetical protein ACWGI0_18005, partial [Streptomyces sp. NPDC054802]
MLVHAVDQGVLVVTVGVDIDISSRAYAVQDIARLVRSHLPLPVVLVLAAPVVSAATLSAVLRVHRMCSGLQVPRGGGPPHGPAPRRPGAPAPTHPFARGVCPRPPL